MRALRLHPNALGQIAEAAARDYPNETCGFLIGRALAGDEVGVDRTVPARNIAAANPARRYEIDPREWLRIDRELAERGESLLGIYHSHPDHPAAPSEFDRDHAWPGYVYLIQGVANGRPGAFGAFQLDATTREFSPVPWAMGLPREQRPRHAASRPTDLPLAESAEGVP